MKKKMATAAKATGLVSAGVGLGVIIKMVYDWFKPDYDNEFDDETDDNDFEEEEKLKK